jgi:TonB family protein
MPAAAAGSRCHPASPEMPLNQQVILCCGAALVFAAALGAAPACAQVGPIEPVIVTSSKPSKTLADIPELREDYVIQVVVTVSADGTVKDVVVRPSSGDAEADTTAINFMKEKQFLPALDANAQPVEAQVLGSVEVHSKTPNKELRANMKAPNTQNEVARVRKLTCKDFLWEMNRLRGQGASPDLSREIMPWVSLRVYMLDKNIPKDAESKYLQKWPKALAEAEQSCQATPDKLYLRDVLMLTLDSLAPNN